MKKNKMKIKKSYIFKKTIPYALKEKKFVLLRFILTIFTALFSASTPFITKEILDKYLPDENYDMVRNLLFLYGGIIISLFIVRYLFQYINNYTGMRIEKRIREDAIYQINMLPVDYY